MHLANGKHKAIVVDEKTHQQNIVSYIYKIKLTQFYPFEYINIVTIFSKKRVLYCHFKKRSFFKTNE